MAAPIEVEVVSVKGKNACVMPLDVASAPGNFKDGMTFKAPGVPVGTKGNVKWSERLNDYLFQPYFQD